MKRIVAAFLGLLLCVAAADAQTIFWKRDHIFAGPGGGEIATVTPAPSDTTAPGAPSSLGTTATTASSVSLSWTGLSDSSGSGLAGYKIYRQKGSGASLPVGTVDFSTTAFTDQPLEPNTSYTYVVVAFDNAQNHSSPSNSVNPTTSAKSDTTAPTAPGYLRLAYLSATEIRLDWDASTDSGGSGLAGYQVYREGTMMTGLPITGLTYTSPVAPNTGYTFTVRAIDNEANVSESDPKSAFRDDFNRANAAGLANSGWSASGGWDLASSRAAATGSPGWVADALTAKSFTSFRANLYNVARPTGFNAGMTFWADGSDKWRFWIYQTTASLAYYTASGGTTAVTASIASWTGGTIRVEANSPTRTIRIYLNDTLTLDYTETNTSRRNTGKAGPNAAVPSGSSAKVEMDDFVIEEGSNSTDTTAPTAPGNLRLAYLSATEIRLDWDASTDSGGSGLAGYRVYREGVLMSGFTPLTGLTYTDSSVSANTGYSFSVKAVDNNSNSTMSGWKSAFRDDFGRSNTTGLSNTSWSAYGNWNLVSNRAAVGTTEGWAAEALSGKSFQTFTATVYNASRPSDSNAGVSFWADGSDLWRFWIYNTTAGLTYYDSSGGTTVTTASISYWTSGNMKVEADSASRNIKIYLNGTLVINYTETDTSRRNSGKAGPNAAVPDYISNNVEMDNFIVEER